MPRLVERDGDHRALAGIEVAPDVRLDPGKRKVEWFIAASEVPGSASRAGWSPLRKDP